MNELKNPFAKDKNGNIVYINNLSKEIKYKDEEFYCAECNQKMILKMGTKNRWHFAHKIASNCQGGFESALHQYAKEIIKNNSNITLPTLTILECREMHSNELIFKNDFEKYLNNDNGNTRYLNKLVLNSNSYKYIWIQNERRINDYIPDCLVKIYQKELAIEILVTHCVDKNKTEKVEKSGIDMIEIDLSDVREILKEENEFDLNEYILFEAPRKWIYKSYIEEFDDIIKNVIYNDGIFVVNNRYTKLESRKELWKKQQMKLKVENPQLFKNKIIINNLKKIPKIIEKYIEIEQSKRLNIYNIPVKGEYAFNCPRSVWQSELFNKFILNRDGKTISLAKINSYFEKYSKISFFKEFDYNDGFLWNSKYDAIKNYIIKLIQIEALRDYSPYDDITHWSEIEIICSDPQTLNSRIKNYNLVYNNIACKNCGIIAENDEIRDKYFLYQFNLDELCFEEYIQSQNDHYNSC